MQQNRESFSANQQNFQESKFAHPKVESIERRQNWRKSETDQWKVKKMQENFEWFFGTEKNLWAKWIIFLKSHKTYS
jgi:hypothetical protein